MRPRWEIRRRPKQRGQALVEFALVIPIFVLLLFGLLDVGRLVYVNNAVAQGAREGARWGAVQGRSATASDRTTVGNRAISLLAAVPAPVASVTCERDGASVATCRTNDVLVVRLQSSVGMLTPVIGQIVGTVTVRGESRVAVQQ